MFTGQLALPSPTPRHDTWDCQDGLPRNGQGWLVLEVTWSASSSASMAVPWLVFRTHDCSGPLSTTLSAPTGTGSGRARAPRGVPKIPGRPKRWASRPRNLDRKMRGSWLESCWVGNIESKLSEIFGVLRIPVFPFKINSQSDWCDACNESGYRS